MKQKIILLRDDDKQELVLREMGEIDREIYALLCEEAYPYEAIENAIQNGLPALTRTLRTENIFPQGVYVAKLSETVQEMFETGERGAKELFFDDVEFLQKVRGGAPVEEEIDIEDADPADIDDLLEDDVKDDDLPENLTAGVGVDSPLKIADDEAEDLDAEPG